MVKFEITISTYTRYREQDGEEWYNGQFGLMYRDGRRIDMC